jgi:tetratricopeptide (TPR) repeat protein
LNANDELLQNAKELEEKCIWAEAAQQYCEALKSSDSITLHERATWCFSRAGIYSSAIEHLEILCERDPKFAKWPYMMGYQFYCEKKWDKAIVWFEKSLAINPNYFVVKYRLAYAFVQLAGEYQKLTKAEYWKALGHLKDCHKLWTNFNDDKRQREQHTYFDINFLHGKMLMELPNNQKEAITLFQKALQIKPDDEICKYNMAKTYYLLGEFEKAKQSIPLSNQYYIVELKAYIDAKLGDYDSAIDPIKHLLQRRKKDYLYSFLVEVYLLTNDLDCAYDMSERAISLGRNNHKNYYTSAKVYNKFGLLSKALSTLDIAIQLKAKRYGSDFLECKSLKDEINLKITPDYLDDKTVLKRLADRCSQNSEKIQQGTICKYNSDKGYGFIRSNGNDVFFHISNCKFRDITIGDEVAFRTESTVKGINANEIVRISNNR